LSIKKEKCYVSSVSECSKSIRINDEPLPSPPSPTKSILPLVSELNNEKTISQDGSKKTFSAEPHDEAILHIINSAIHDYLLQGKTFIYY
jgi:hypothetical protein